jgi:type II secretory pathway pseudopilin PulG
MMRAHSGYSLIQIIIAGVVLGMVGMATAPRWSSAAFDTRTATLCENLQEVRRHIEVYRRHNEGRLPALEGETGDDFSRRMTQTAYPGEAAGPRLSRIPTNPFNRLDTIRIGGPPAGAGTHGWRFDPHTGRFQADNDHDANGDGLPKHAHL